jgi:hypothetical protein
MAYIEPSIKQVTIAMTTTLIPAHHRYEIEFVERLTETYWMMSSLKTNCEMAIALLQSFGVR